MIGGTGFISSFVVRCLVAAEQEVTIFHRSQESPLPSAVRHISGDRACLAEFIDVYRARDRNCRCDPGPPDPTTLTEDSPLRDRLFPYAETRPEPGTDAFATTYDKILVVADCHGSTGFRVYCRPLAPGLWARRLFTSYFRVSQTHERWTTVHSLA